MSDAVNSAGNGLPPGFGVIESPSPMGSNSFNLNGLSPMTMSPLMAPTGGLPGMNQLTGLPMAGMGGAPMGAYPQPTIHGATSESILGKLMAPSPGVTPVFGTQGNAGASKTLGMKAPPKGVDVTLKRGASGKPVAHLQKQLKAVGIKTGTADGKFDKAVERGVRAFQKRVGLKPTGIATRKVQEKLANKVGQTLGKKGGSSPAPGAAAPATVYPGAATTAGMAYPAAGTWPAPQIQSRPTPQLNATSQQGLASDPAHPANQHVANDNAVNGDGWNLGGIQHSAMASMPFSSSLNSGMSPYMPFGGALDSWGWGAHGRNMGYTGWATNPSSGGVIGWFKNLLGFGS